MAAHTGIIYDFAKRTQVLLQGHVRAPRRLVPQLPASPPHRRPQCNPITACCVSDDRRWIATADAGPESMIVVWDALTGTPIKTIFTVRRRCRPRRRSAPSRGMRAAQPHERGVLAMDMSPDAMFLVTLSNVEGEGAGAPCRFPDRSLRRSLRH